MAPDRDAQFMSAVARAREVARRERSDATLDDVQIDQSHIIGCVQPSPVFRKVQTVPRSSGDGERMLGWIIADVERERQAASIKPQNASRDVSRVLNVVALFGLLNMAVADKSPAQRVLSALIGFGFAAYAMTKATIGYSDACILHKAWKIAGARSPRTFTLDEILSLREDIVAEYKAPKCASETEIRDAINNLIGLKSIRPQEGCYLLRENITFFEDGSIKG